MSDGPPALSPGTHTHQHIGPASCGGKPCALLPLTMYVPEPRLMRQKHQPSM